jgi:radical SAM protein with 4Fe4S-binding SPASM domain
MEFIPFNTAKFLSHADRVDKILKRKMPPPVTAEIYLTNKCNHACIWCVSEDYRWMTNDKMPIERFTTLLEELSQRDVRAISLSGGGEPLLHPKFDGILDIMARYKHKFKYGLVTNGVFLNRHIEKINDLFQWVRISLDAANSEQHYVVHKGRQDDFERIIDNISQLHSPYVGVGYLVCEDNCKDIYDFIIGTLPRNVDYIQIRPAYWTHQLSLNDANNFVKEVEEAKRDKRSNLLVYINMHRFDTLKNQSKEFLKCHSTPLIAIVGPEGNLYLCCQRQGEKDALIGNIMQSNFWSVWDSEAHWQAIDSIDVKQCPSCRNAPYNKIIEQAFEKDGMHKEFL